MTDQDIMPFGTHRGKKMENVPAYYLVWLKETAEKTGNQISHEGVRKYIEDNWSVLKSEMPDRIWS